MTFGISSWLQDMVSSLLFGINSGDVPGTKK